jgi:clan AA aspartic protease
MIHGTVNYRNEPVVPLRIRGPSGTEVEVDAVIDTAFTGQMTLPPALISALSLTGHSQISTQLADGTVRNLDAYDVEIEWDGAWATVTASEIDCVALLGLGLLSGHELFIEFNPGGVVEIRRLP